MSERDVRLGGYAGREITFESASGVERVRWFVVGKRLYEIRIAIGGVGTAEERDYALLRETRRFLDRFRLTDASLPQFGAEPKRDERRGSSPGTKGRSR